MKKALILCNGRITDYTILNQALASLMSENPTVIAVDGGAGHAINLGYKIDTALGDFDSIEPEHMEHITENDIEVISFPADKDMTDSELALHHCIQNGFKNLTVAGFSGTRLDHTIGNIMLLAKLGRDISIRLVDENNEAFFCTDIIELEAHAGANISIIPLFGDIVVKNTEGLHYKLSNKRVTPGSTLCISNFAVDRKQIIELAEGEALITISRD
ncbi:MAG: thiamine diphosphokinase [Spirochaetes bacterium]|nr:thiamine diphosphokinase [Spirochaetota bacterium]MBN2769624.1 thiamine diphosphokinase [Spirochaetota bacterium]